MKTYNQLNTVIFILTGVFLLILLTLDFESVTYTIVQCVFTLLTFPILKYTYYDFDKFCSTKLNLK